MLQGVALMLPPLTRCEIGNPYSANPKWQAIATFCASVGIGNTVVAARKMPDLLHGKSLNEMLLQHYQNAILDELQPLTRIGVDRTAITFSEYRINALTPDE